MSVLAIARSILPAGRWTTAPTLVDAAKGACLIVASVEGLVVALDQKFQLLWQHKLLIASGMAGRHD